MTTRDETTLHAAQALYDQLNKGQFLGGDTQRIAHIQVFLNELLDAEALSFSPPTADAKHNLDDELSRDEERLLRKIDAMFPDGVQFGGLNATQNLQREQQRWRAIARTHIQEGFMALRRAIYNPARVRLPEDVP